MTPIIPHSPRDATRGSPSRTASQLPQRHVDRLLEVLADGRPRRCVPPRSTRCELRPADSWRVFPTCCALAEDGLLLRDRTATGWTCSRCRRTLPAPARRPRSQPPASSPCDAALYVTTTARRRRQAPSLTHLAGADASSAWSATAASRSRRSSRPARAELDHRRTTSTWWSAGWPAAPTWGCCYASSWCSTWTRSTRCRRTADHPRPEHRHRGRHRRRSCAAAACRPR